MPSLTRHYPHISESPYTPKHICMSTLSRALCMTLTHCKGTHSAIIGPDTSYGGVQEGFCCTKELIFLDWEVVACWTCLCLTPEGTRQNIGRVRCISHNLASSAQTVLGVDCAHWGQVTANTSASCTHHPGEKDFKNI